MEYLQEFLFPFLSALGGGLAVLILGVPKRRKEEQEAMEQREGRTNSRFDALESGVRAILKDKIQKEYLMICNDGRKYAKPYEKANVSNLFAAYTTLGGNGYIEKLYDQIMNKPVQKDEDDILK